MSALPPDPAGERPEVVTDPSPAWPIGVTTLASTFLRAFTIQGSWNYRTMLGSGFAFVLLPVLRQVRGQRGPALEAALSRHADHFNAHPYMANVAVGAVARLEIDGERPEVIDRFKAAVRGPLGGVGDTLVWTGLLPTSLLLTLAAAWAGLSPGLSVLLFLTVYNMGHLAIRAWAFVVGFQEGILVGARLRGAALAHRTEVLLKAGSLLLGVLSGLLMGSDQGFAGAGPVWSVAAVGAFAAGLGWGIRSWRPAALAVVAVTFLLFAVRVVQ